MCDCSAWDRIESACTLISFSFYAEAQRTEETQGTSLQAMYLAHDSVFETGHVEIDQQAHAVIAELSYGHPYFATDRESALPQLVCKTNLICRFE